MAARNLGYLSTQQKIDPGCLFTSPLPVFTQSRYVKTGHIYVIFCPVTFLFKIGVTENLEKRIRSFETQNSTPVRLLHKIKSSDIFREEVFIHTILASRLDHGEWFRLGWADLSALKRYRSRV